jgi:HSP20 family protein
MSKTSVEIKKAETPVLPAMWRSFRNEIDSLFDRFDTSFAFPSFRRLTEVDPFWTGEQFNVNLPAVDVTEDDAAFKITAELPGLDEKNITLTMTGDQLVLKGEKSEEKEEKSKSRYLSERSYGAFQRSFRLPDIVDRAKVEANFAKGVLTVKLPKAAEAKAEPKKIAVKAAA